MTTSSLNELIDRSSKMAYNSGVDEERRRTIAILKTLPQEFNHNDFVMRAVAKAIAEIRA